jgi:hypothetical protein
MAMLLHFDMLLAVASCRSPSWPRWYDASHGNPSLYALCRRHRRHGLDRRNDIAIEVAGLPQPFKSYRSLQFTGPARQPHVRCNPECSRQQWKSQPLSACSR